MLTLFPLFLSAQSFDFNDDSSALIDHDLVIALCQQQRPEAQLPPSPFTTDGCSAWPDGAWHACCLEHDYAYWCGGTTEQRKQADKELQRCVAAAGYSVISRVMFLGVRVGGLRYWPLPWRWGYGWGWLDDGAQ